MSKMLVELKKFDHNTSSGKSVAVKRLFLTNSTVQSLKNNYVIDILRGQKSVMYSLNSP
jgi:hypothetical protein